MPSKAVTHRRKGALAVQAVADHQTQPLAAALGERLEGGEGLNLTGLIHALLQVLAVSTERLVSADEAHEAELADDPATRDARTAAFEEAQSTLVALREALSGLYDSRTAKQVFRGDTPRDPTAIVAYAQEVANNLRAAPLPPPRIRIAQLDAAAQAAALEAKKAALQAALEAVAREEREAQTTLSAKNTALADYDRVFNGVAKMLEGAFILAEMDDFAARVRPSTRRPGRTEVAEEEEEPTETGAAS